jgi:hypothetical protein
MAAVGAATGAILNGLHQELLNGGIDWSLKGWESLGITAVGAAILAVYALYTNSPKHAAELAAKK